MQNDDNKEFGRLIKRFGELESRLAKDEINFTSAIEEINSVTDELNALLDKNEQQLDEIVNNYGDRIIRNEYELKAVLLRIDSLDDKLMNADSRIRELEIGSKENILLSNQMKAIERELERVTNASKSSEDKQREIREKLYIVLATAVIQTVISILLSR